MNSVKFGILHLAYFSPNSTIHPIIVYLWTWNTIEFQSLLRLKLVEPIINVAFGIMCEDMDSEDFDDTEAEANTAPQFASQVCCLHSQFNFTNRKILIASRSKYFRIILFWYYIIFRFWMLWLCIYLRKNLFRNW